MNKRNILGIIVAGVALLSLAACSSGKSDASKHSYTVGVASAEQKEVWQDVVAPKVKKEGITIKVKQFSDYTEEDPATQDGSLDLNSFQHIAYLDNWNKTNKGTLVPIAYTIISPLGLYSKKITNINQIKDGDTIGVPNDPTNEGRALQLLAAINVITLKKDAPSSPGLKDIEKYNKKVTIKELQADQIAPALPDLTAAIINSNYVVDQLHETPKDALYVDTDHLEKVSHVYKNVIVVNKKNKNNPDFKKIIKAYQTDATKKIIEKYGDKPAW